MTARPDPAFPAPDGWHHVAMEDLDWRVGGDRRQCRFFSRRERCPNGAVAAFRRQRRLLRGTVDVWWHYCGDHMYGRWIEDGRVMAWHVARDEGGNGG